MILGSVEFVILKWNIGNKMFDLSEIILSLELSNPFFRVTN